MSSSTSTNPSSSSSMDDLITSVCNQVGIEPSVAQQAIGAILVFIKNQATQRGFDFDKITSKLKGALQLMQDAPTTQQEARQAAASDRAAAEETKDETKQESTPPPPPQQAEFTWLALIQWILTAGPLLELLKKILGLVFGEGAVKMLTSASESADLLGILENLGINREMSKKLVSILVKYMNTKLGPDTMQQLAESVPALEPFVQETKKDE